MYPLNLKKELRHLYRPSAKQVSVVDVPSMNFIMVDGSGDPNTSPAYVAALEALYAVAYTLKFKLKQGADAVEFSVMPLEGLWWADDMRAFSGADKDAWQWTMMIMQPAFVTADEFAEAVVAAQKKKRLPALPQLRFAPYHEGPSAQILYTGPYADEGPTITQLHAFIHAQGHELAGKHHEIYLKDPRKSAPEKLQTVIRQPFK